MGQQQLGQDDPPQYNYLLMHKLLKGILTNYSKEVQPTKPVTVLFKVLLIKVKSTIEREGIFEVVVSLFMKWNDPRLSWEPSVYDNVTIIAFDSQKVWIPDIAMVNSADHIYAMSKDTQFVVRTAFNGDAHYVPSGTARTWCNLKLMTFPFDIQKCSMEFESWTLDMSQLVFDNASTVVLLDSFMSAQWHLCRHSTIIGESFYDVSNETFSKLIFDFTVKRKSIFYIMNLMFPCAMLSITLLLVFIIPIKDSPTDRVAFGTTNLLTLVVFQTTVTAEMPKASDAVSALSKYVMALMLLAAVGIIESVIVQRLVRIQSIRPPAFFLWQFNRFWENEKPPSVIVVEEVGPGVEAVRLARRSSPIWNRQCIPWSPSSACKRSPELIRSRTYYERQALLSSSEATNLQDSERRRRRSNARLWLRFAARLDALMFISCSLVAFLLPMGIFVPRWIAIDDICPDSADETSDNLDLQ